MNRRMETRVLSAIAETATSDGSPVSRQFQRQPVVRSQGMRAQDYRGQNTMDDREKDAHPDGSGADTGDGRQKQKPQLDRPTQTRIGDQLRSMYAELMDQPVPDRFRSLLDQLDESGKQAKPDREDGR